MSAKHPAEAAAYAAARRSPAEDGDDAEVSPGGKSGAAATGEDKPAAEPGAEGLASPTSPPGAISPEAPDQPDDEHEHEHEHEVERDLDELAAKAEKADEYLVLAQRTRADFENYRKRATREAALAQERGIARLAKELLPAIDNLDRAVQAAAAAPGSPASAGEDGDSQLISGIRLVQADLLAALARVGIEPFSPVGEAFDPQWHEAVAQIPVEGRVPGTVVEVYQPGYRLGETVLRPARVLVAA
jgi:molecular chaperone GrpE